MNGEGQYLNPLSRRRFDALAGYIRSPWSVLFAQELAWYEAGDERVLGLVSLDRADRDYVATVLGRDARRRFRAVSLQINLPTVESAIAWLGGELKTVSLKPDSWFHQGDEAGFVVDFFAPIVAVGKRSEAYERLRTEKQFSPARALMHEMMHHYEDVDGNFVEQFQSVAFDARLWELYLFALFSELGYARQRVHPAPDIHCVGPLGEFFVEATTVNPSPEPPEVTDANQSAYFDGYVPIKFGSALLSKIDKQYWTLPHVVGQPFVLAIQDFHTRGAMTWSNTGLVEYLYGLRQIERQGESGTEIVSEPIFSHQWLDKKIPSGFFGQPHSENVSAVIANPSGTLSKFNRIGFLAGFGARDLLMFRRGVAYKGTTSPTSFAAEVHDASYEETWCEGLSVYHNPHALHPLPWSCFPGAAQHGLRRGQLVASMPSFFPLGSQTFILGTEDGVAHGTEQT